MSGDRTADVARLAEALHRIYGPPGSERAGRYLTDAAALLPVVDAIADERARQRAAEALEEAADHWDRPTVRTVASDLRDRARLQRDGDR